MAGWVSSPDVFQWPARAARCRTRTSPRAKMAARRFSRVSSIVHLAVGGRGFACTALGHREPRFRDNLKASVAKSRRFLGFGPLSAASMTNDAMSENRSDLTPTFFRCRVTRGRKNSRQHNSASILRGPRNVNADCVHPWVMYAVRHQLCAQTLPKCDLRRGTSSIPLCKSFSGLFLPENLRFSQMPHALWHCHTSCGAPSVPRGHNPAVTARVCVVTAAIWCVAAQFSSRSP